jgi:hypothetical protein
MQIINLLLVASSGVTTVSAHTRFFTLGLSSRPWVGNHPRTVITYGRGCRMVPVKYSAGQNACRVVAITEGTPSGKYDTRRAGGYPCPRPSRPWSVVFKVAMPWLPNPYGAKSDTESQAVSGSQWHYDTAAGWTEGDTVYLPPVNTGVI